MQGLTAEFKQLKHASCWCCPSPLFLLVFFFFLQEWFRISAVGLFLGWNSGICRFHSRGSWKTNVRGGKGTWTHFFIRMKISPWIKKKSVTAYALSECNKLVHTVVTLQTYFSSCSVQEKFHKQVYGVSISSSKSNFASSIIENPEMLKIQQRHVMKQQTLANTNKPPAPPPPLIPSGTPTKQDSSAMNGRCDCFTLTLSRIKVKGSTVYIITG